VLDATDEHMIRALGEGTFDAVSCQMALMDMPEIAPLMRAAYALLKPGGCFVFSVVHPAFFQTNAIRFAEAVDLEGELVTIYGMKITHYMTPYTAWGSAIPGQPEVQPYFERPLHVTLGAGFAAGFVLDALQERAFPPLHPHDNSTRRPLSWGGNFSEIPLVLVARLRR
jgi:SAM-dependent methyltransferase